MLVAPAEPALFGLEEQVLPEKLPVPGVMFVSHNDPLIPFKRARFWAECWGAHLIDLGDAGHINSAAGFGEWEFGLAQLAAFGEGLETDN